MRKAGSKSEKNFEKDRNTRLKGDAQTEMEIKNDAEKMMDVRPSSIDSLLSKLYDSFCECFTRLTLA